jgi:hypothetical protein
MDNSEAIEILEIELNRYRPKSYSELKKLISAKPIGKEVRTYNDADYNIEVVVNWNEDEEGDIKVLAYVEDGEMRSFIPLTKSFIKTSDDQFKEE